MRSAEPSDVTSNVFAFKTEPTGALASPSMFAAAMRFAADISPLTLAVGTTALVGAVIYIACDVVRTLEEAQALAAYLPQSVRAGEIPGLWERGLLALAIAVAAAVLSFRRRSTVASHAVDEILATIPFGVAVWSDSGRLKVCNEQFLQRLDRDAAKPAPARTYAEAVRRLTTGGRVEIVRDGQSRRLMELRRDDDCWLLIDERPLPAGGFVTLVTDITESRRTDLLLISVREEQRALARRYHEEKLKAEAASRAKTSFLAHLSHDIRTPLNHIIGFADLIRHQAFGPLGDARYLGYVDTIKASGEKLLGSFASILELAELEGGTRALREETLAVDELLRTVIRRFAAQAGRAGLSLAIGTPCDAAIVADRFCLERMLGNLIENAIRFTPSGGKVTLAAYAADDGVVIEISDTGIGMAEEQLNRLSQPFVFGDAAFTREHHGAGLGVAISRAIAELSGGRLVVDSSPAVGTTVAVSLPLHTEAHGTEQAA